MRIRFLTLLGLLLAPSLAQAQSSVYICIGPPGIGACQPVSASNPWPVTGTVTAETPAAESVTITTPSVPTPGTFVNLLAANTSRKGCTVTNNGTTTGRCNAIDFASNSTAKSMPVSANGGQFECASTSGPPASNAISCTCDSGTCAFAVNEQ